MSLGSIPQPILPPVITQSLWNLLVLRHLLTRNRLKAAIPPAVNADLRVGQLSESVTVEANIAQLNTESATVGKTVEQKQIQNLALNGRNPLFLALLKPGVRRGGSISDFSYGLDSAGFTIDDELVTPERFRA